MLVELKSGYTNVQCSHNIQMMVPVCKIYLDGTYYMPSGMQNKMLLPSYYTKILEVNKYRGLMDTIIHLVQPLSRYRGSCKVATPVLQHLVGVSRYTIADGLKYLSEKGAVIYHCTTGRTASNHIEMVARDESGKEISNGFVEFTPGVVSDYRPLILQHAVAIDAPR